MLINILWLMLAYKYFLACLLINTFWLLLAYKYFLINAYKYLTAFVTKPSPSLSINLSKKKIGLEGFFPHQQNKRVGVFFCSRIIELVFA